MCSSCLDNHTSDSFWTPAGRASDLINNDFKHLQCSPRKFTWPWKLTSLMLNPWLRRGDSLSSTSGTLYHNKKNSHLTCNTSYVNSSHTSTNVLSKTWLFSLDESRRVPKKKTNSCRATCLNQQFDTETSCLWFSVFLPSALEGNTLVACLTCLSQPQFCTELFWVWCFIPIKGWAATLFSFCCHT